VSLNLPTASESVDGFNFVVAATHTLGYGLEIINSYGGQILVEGKTTEFDYI
jgi:hypothetical protein